MERPKFFNHNKESDNRSTQSTTSDIIDSIHYDYFNSLYDHHPDAVFTLDAFGNMTNYNKSVKKIFGYDDHELALSFNRYFIFGKEQWITHFQGTLQGVTQNFKTKIPHKNGSLIDVDIIYIPIFNQENAVIGIYGFAKDMTKYVQSQKELTESEHRFKNVYTNLEAGIWSQEMEEKNYTLISPGVKHITGYSSTYFQKGSWISMIHPEDLDTYKNQQQKLWQGEKLYHQYRIHHASGEVRWILDQTIPVFDANGKLIRLDGIISNITELKEYEDKIKHLAYHDHLTGLPNSRMFTDKIEELTNEESSSFAILLINIDRFKNINETLGRGMGDALLKSFSNRMKQILNNGALYTRLGGDEFGILILDLTEDITLLAQKMIDQMKKPFIINDFEIHMTISIGISLSQSNTGTAEDVIKSAHAALSRAKEMGKNHFQIFGSRLDQSYMTRYTLENDLYKAIYNEELFLVFQPRVDSMTGTILGAEALIRWNHPQLGTISPSEFIPLAEENGLIIDIGDWVLKEVCKYIKLWNEQNLPIVPISINLSAQRFLKNDLITLIKSLLKEYKTDPTFIELELTESTLLLHEEMVNDILRTLKEIGVKVALDDFGTGYSSMSYLKKYPIDIIKIDQSFTQNIGNSQSDEIIIQSIIFLARGLNKRVIAEGVETDEQLIFLQQQGCDEIQGYYFCKPVSDKEFQLFLAKRAIQPWKESPLCTK
jgi:diguanylate cyclase (GGDEF)-like protein/PAS domain S-box-containing protein